MSKFKSIGLYLLIGVIISLVFVRVAVAIDNNEFQNIVVAITKSEKELQNEMSDRYNQLINEQEILEHYENTYDEYMQLVPENAQYKNGYILAGISQMQEYRDLFITKELVKLYSIAILVGIVFGLLLYLIANAKVKYNLIKLVLGYVILFAVASLIIEIGFTGIATMLEFHAVAYIFTTLLIYIALVVFNVLVQKYRVKKLNKEITK